MLVGPIVAALAFVCSIGNVPLAAVLWAGGGSFAGVIAFLYGDLIVLPIVAVYRKVYGGRAAALLVGVMYGTMVLAALAVDGLFSAVGLAPIHRPSLASVAERPVTWNYTSFLDLVAVAVFVGAACAHGAPRREGPGLRHDGRPPREWADLSAPGPHRPLLQRAVQAHLRSESGGIRMTHGYVLSDDREALLRRLRRIEGQVRGLQKMVEEERYCIDILTQLSAATAGLERVAMLLVSDHVRHCVRTGGEERVDELMTAVEQTGPFGLSLAPANLNHKVAAAVTECVTEDGRLCRTSPAQAHPASGTAGGQPP